METPVPAVSVVIPLYNKSATIESTIGSVLRQTFGSFEVMVVDDGSTDGSGDVVRKISDPRIRVITQSNQGVSAARNRGVRESRAELVAFLDGDDEWLPDFLATVVDMQQRFPNAGMYVTGIRKISTSGSVEEVFAATPGGCDGEIEDYFMAPSERRMICPSSSAIRKDVFDRAGGFPLGEPMGEDLDLWAKIAVATRIVFTRRILVLYHTDDGQREKARAWMKPPYPPELRNLRKIVADYPLDPQRAASMKRYIDYHALRNLYWQLNLALPSAASVVLTEPFYGWRYRVEAALLRLAVRVLPPRVIWAIRWRPVHLARRIVRMFRRPVNEMQGCRSVWRRIA